MSQGKTDLLPSHHSQFSSRIYWDDFFKERNHKAFEWYGSYEQLSGYIDDVILTIQSSQNEHNVLVIGCGNSDFSSSLYENNIIGIYNIDFSHVVIEEMQLKCGNKYPKMYWSVMDMMKLEYPNSSFNIVLDKGSLDALMSEDTEMSRQQAFKMFDEIDRVLVINQNLCNSNTTTSSSLISASSGIYICISLCQDYILQTLLSYFNSSHWMIKIFLVESLLNNPLVPFVIIITRINTTTSSAEDTLQSNHIYFDATGQRLHTPNIVNSNELLEKVSSFQQYHIKRLSMQELQLDRFEVLDFYADMSSARLARSARSARSNDIPKYSIIVYDFTNNASRLCAAFFVPMGREADYQFSTPQGLADIATQADCCRLLVIRCYKPHIFPPMAELQIELTPLLLSLKPMSTCNLSPHAIDDFPFMAIHTENTWNSIHIGTTSLSGDYCIEEQSQLDNDEEDDINDNTGVEIIRRRLLYLSNQSLIQTEVELIAGEKKKKKKNKKKTASTNIVESNSGNNVENRFVFSMKYIDDHHRGLLLAFLFSPSIMKRIHGELKINIKDEIKDRKILWTQGGVKIGLIGVGGGALVMFVQKYIPSHSIDAVEIEPDMLDIAQKYFGLKLSTKTTFIAQDGLTYIQNKSMGVPLQHDLLDVLLIDVDCKDASLGITAPPPTFITIQNLTNIYNSLSPDGILAMNVAIRVNQYYDELIFNLKNLFESVFEIRPNKESLNIVVVAVKGASAQLGDLKLGLTKWLKSIGDNADELNLSDLLVLTNPL